MKKILIGLFLFLAYSVGMAASAPQPLDKIVAVLNSDVITESQLQKQIALVKKQNANIALPDNATLRKKVLDQLIDERLILMLAKRNKLEISDAQLNQGLIMIAQRNNLNLDQLEGAVEKQGMTYDDFRQQVRNQMLIQQVEGHALGPDLAVSNQEIKDFMRQHPNQNLNYHVVDILVPVTNATDASAITAAQNRANTLLQQLQANGANQAQILAADKDVNVSDLGFRPINQLPEIFAPAIQTMKAGELKGPMRAPNGFHLIRLVEAKSTGTPLTSAQARMMLMQQKLGAAVPAWIKKMRATAYVKIMD